MNNDSTNARPSNGMTNIVATYHRDCPDGTTAAACLLKKHPEAKVFPLSHSHTPGELAAVLAAVDSETEAYTLDCVLGAQELAAKAKTLTIIDHHVGVEEQIKKFAKEHENVTLIFDSKHSGAGLAWRHFHSDLPVPKFIDLVEDVDLWNWKYGDQTRHLGSYTYLFINAPHDVVPMLTADVEPFIEKGKSIAHANDHNVTKYFESAEPVWLTVGRDCIPLYNSPFFTSDIGNRGSEKHGSVSGACNIRGNNVRLNFRSKEGNNPTALDIASRLGGGGQKHAAGATMTRENFFKALK